MGIPRILITPGEPAGVGPDLVCALAQHACDAELIAVCDPALLGDRARHLGLPLRTTRFDPAAARRAQAPGAIRVLPVALARPVTAGHLDPGNARYVLETLDQATALCLSGAADALVTGPVQKSVINDAGIAFSGHTEFLAQRCGGAGSRLDLPGLAKNPGPGHPASGVRRPGLPFTAAQESPPQPVMMLVTRDATRPLRVALATTHLPLRAVADAITAPLLESVLRILVGDLHTKFGIAEPHVLICGLNPHAGESGHLGREEIEIIAPVIERLRAEGMRLLGPLPADTLFTPRHLAGADAVLAMYHDQGLPVLKHAGFGEAVNVTLGLPILRTSVDHGTALDLAGSGRADTGSLRAALDLAIELAGKRRA